MTYRDLFGFLCLLCFLIGLWTQSPYAYWGALVTGALSRASVKKGWQSPPWMRELNRSSVRRTLGRFHKDENEQ